MISILMIQVSKYSETDEEVFVSYLYRNKGWNASYQTLTFLFRNGTIFEDHAKVIEKSWKNSFHNLHVKISLRDIGKLCF